MSAALQELLGLGDRLFERRRALESYWQTVAEHFYPERADFTASFNLGDEFADHLTTSYPIIARRELAGALSAMMRPRDDEWFATEVEGLDDIESKRWLEWATRTQRAAMYARQTKFTRAMPQGDNDFSTFGQCVITVEMSPRGQDFLYRCKHLKDIAWKENATDDIDTVYEKWKPTVRDLTTLFPSVHRSVAACKAKEPFREIACRRVVIPSEHYVGNEHHPEPFVSLYVDVENQFVMEEIGVWASPYVIPRWQTVSGSQYAYSPATVAALPDARLIQAVTLTLLDAAEMQASPPMAAVEDVIRGDINLKPRGITFLESDYDEKTGAALRPVMDNRSANLNYGMELRSNVKEMIAEAFYLNKLSLPPAQNKGDMTAFEVGQRVQEYIRSALPLFEPMEMEFNGGVCEATFELGMRNGLFGPRDTIPKPLRGRDVRFKFNSPLSQAIERKDAARFVETAELLATAAQIDPSTAATVDASKALNDALDGIGSPAKWRRSPEEIQAIRDAAEQQQRAAQTMAEVEQGAEIAEKVGGAIEAFRGKAPA